MFKFSIMPVIISALLISSCSSLSGIQPSEISSNPAIDVSEPGEAGFSGSLIVADFDDLQQAREWADSDPYVSAGVYSSVVVKPFIKVLP